MDINSTVELRDGRIGEIKGKFLYRNRPTYDVECEGVRSCVSAGEIASVIAKHRPSDVPPPAPKLGMPSLESRTEYAFATALDDRKFAQERANLESEIVQYKAMISEKQTSIRALEKLEKQARGESAKMLRKGLCVEAVIAQLRALFPRYAAR